MIKIAAGAAILCLIGFGLGAGLTKLIDQQATHGAAGDASAQSSMRHSSQMQAHEGRSATAQ